MPGEDVFSINWVLGLSPVWGKKICKPVRFRVNLRRIDWTEHIKRHISYVTGLGPQPQPKHGNILMDTDDKKALILLGMHRSGLSALGGCIDLLGLDSENSLSMGDRNEYSPYEGIMVQHEMLLKNLGCRWDMMGNLPKGWPQSAAAKEACKKLSGIIDQSFPENRFLAINDPRMCRLMPLWKEVLKEKQIRPCFVLLVRHPYEVARSLEEAAGFDLLKGHLLWLVHNREALAACSGHDYVIITYDALLADPVYCMEKISKQLGVPFIRQPRLTYSRLIDFVRSDLKHYYGGSREHTEERFTRYEWLYDQLRMSQAPALAGAETSGPDVIGNPGMETAIREFPLAAGAGSDGKKTDTGYITEMLDDIMAVLSVYEQNDVDSERRREKRLFEAEHKGDFMYAHVYFPESEREETQYTPENSRKVLLAPDTWQKASVFISDPDMLRLGRLRIDPLNTTGTVHISSVNLVNPANGDIIWSAYDGNRFSACDIEGDVLYPEKSENGLVIHVIGADARILIPELPTLPEAPLTLEIWIKVTRSLKPLGHAWIEKDQRLKALAGQVEEISRVLENAQASEDENRLRLEQQLAEAREEIREKQDELAASQEQLAASEKRVEDMWEKVVAQDEKIMGYSSELAEAERRFAELHGWFSRLADLLGFDETTASSSLHLVKKSSKVFSRKAPIDEIQTVFRNFYAMMPGIEASLDIGEDGRWGTSEDDGM